jgi:polysaccharide pyruvyl transferase WcaK-like protein
MESPGDFAPSPLVSDSGKTPKVGAFGSTLRRRLVSRIRRARRRGEPRYVPGQLPPLSEHYAAPILPLAPSEPPGPRLVLLNDCRDQMNFGAKALIDGLLQGLTTAIPSATIQPIPSHWLLDTSQGFGMFVADGAGMVQPPAVYPEVADQFDDLADEWLLGQGGPGAEEFLSRLRGADAVLLNGEGSLYRTNLSAIRELFLAWLCKTRLEIPTVYLNGMVHLTNVMPVLPAMVRKSFAALDAVAVRDPYSLRNLARFAPDVEVQLLPDSAFLLGPEVARQPPEMELIRERLGDRPYFCFDPGLMPIDVRPGGRSAVYQLIMRLKEVVPEAVFVRNNPSDSFIRTVAEETGSLYIDTIVDYRDWMTVAAGARFLVTGFYHNTILAAVMGCPVIALGTTSHKVHGACEMLGGAVSPPLDGTDLRPQMGTIADRAREYDSCRDHYRARLQAVCQANRSDAAGLGHLAASLVRNSVFR